MQELPKILSFIGLIKNQLLLASCVGGFFFGCLGYEVMDKHQVFGESILIASILIFIAGLCFYCYAIFKLPSSRQELMFSEAVRKNIEEHNEKKTQ